MNLYLVQWDGDQRYVEAVNFGEAVAIWRDAMLEEWGEGDWSDDEEPESCARVDDRPVLRRVVYESPSGDTDVPENL